MAGTGGMSDPIVTTRGDMRDAADICRERGWKAGQRLVGDEGGGPEVIELTAVGERQILARTITRNGQVPGWAREASWNLSCRDWKEAT